MKPLTKAYSRLVNEAATTPEIIRASYIAKSAPSTHEIGWLGHKKFKGTKEKVQIEFDPNDEKIQDEYLYHTHPVDGDATPFNAMPSEQDLESAKSVVTKGLKGIVVFAHPYYTVITATKKTKEKTNYNRYIEAIKRNDIEDAVKEIEKLGFDIETGKL